MKNKKKLLVSFSGGETSGYMANWIKQNLSSEFELLFIFANTGEENEETLIFADQCDKAYKLNLVWVECKPYLNERKGSGYTIVNFETASRKGEPFELMIKKYGIPNQAFPHCTRELKLNPINSYAKSIGWGDYYTAIGIRADEIDRVSPDRHKRKLIYPLADSKFKPMTKQKINLYWSKQPFRLQLTEYQGNCKVCFKKSFKKLYQIAKDDPKNFDFVKRMELKYSRHQSKGVEQKLENDIVFFRNNTSADQVIKDSKKWHGKIHDKSKDLPNYELFTDVESESCEIYSNCGDK